MSTERRQCRGCLLLHIVGGNGLVRPHLAYDPKIPGWTDCPGGGRRPVRPTETIALTGGRL